MGIYFAKTAYKIYNCAFIYNKEELWIYFIENAEIMYQWGFILLKLLIKSTALNLLKTKKVWRFVSLKMQDKVPLAIYFVETLHKMYTFDFI